MESTRLGHVVTERVDDKDFCNEKLEFEKFFKFYQNVLRNVSVSIKTLEEVFSNKKPTKTFQKYCPAFFESLVDNFWSQSVIELNEFFRGRDFSIKKFINYTKANWNQIFTGRWIETTKWDDGTTEVKRIKYNLNDVLYRINEVELLIERNKNIISKIRNFRDKVYAHVDKEYPKEELRLLELREIFGVAEKIFNCLVSMYDNVYICLEPCNSDDIKNIIKCVEAYDKYKEAIREARRKEFDNKKTKVFVDG